MSYRQRKTDADGQLEVHSPTPYTFCPVVGEFSEGAKSGWLLTS